MVYQGLSAWLALHHASGIGLATAAQLLHHFHHPDRLFAAGPDGWREAGIGSTARAALTSPDDALIERELAWGSRPGQGIISRDDPRYPRLLAQIPDPPLVLYVVGDPSVLARPQVAMVGSRNPTPTGLDQAFSLSFSLSGIGLTITSGLALGIDAQSHRGALRAGVATIAVMGTGVDRVYPSAHQGLAAEIADSGALVSEYPLGAGPTRASFPRRNRIISGLSLGTVVVEAAARSGSLISARMALEQGREVFAMPGAVTNLMARGCHALLREGACLVEGAEDVVRELFWPVLPDETLGPVSLSDDDRASSATALLRCIDSEPVSVDGLVRRSGLGVAEVNAQLLQLELDGVVSPVAGRGYRRGKSTR
ncbi:MAG TPA: DNA-protecting protein DprA [Chromatiales bacterium]|jgi:DNA processing protein|nr:DNA-protecting protein DprA [Chromatiaceae bacterium]HIO54101.1 DNA-protecting protein DprA [Chromatiales bacterium]